jgi:hypothetical protein
MEAEDKPRGRLRLPIYVPSSFSSYRQDLRLRIRIGRVVARRVLRQTRPRACALGVARMDWELFSN